jgi:hypothetical protein
VGHANGVDWLIGRTLPSMVSKRGLGRPQAKTDVQHIRGRDRGALSFRLFVAEVRDPVVDGGRLDAATFDAASGFTHPTAGSRPSTTSPPTPAPPRWRPPAARLSPTGCHGPGTAAQPRPVHDGHSPGPSSQRRAGLLPAQAGGGQVPQGGAALPETAVVGRRRSVPAGRSAPPAKPGGTRAGASTADGAASATCRRPGAPGARPTRRSTPGASRQCPYGAATRER